MCKRMRLMAMLLLAVLLIGCLPPGTAAAFSPSYDTIRVGLNGYRCWNTPGYVNLYNSGGLRVGSYDGNRQFSASGSQSYNSLKISGSGSSVVITDSSGNTVASGSSVAVAPVNTSITTTYALPGASYGDGLSSSYEFYGGFVATSSGGSLTVVNYVGLEDYVKGVVPYEAYPSWPLEMLKAQALCARTYAVSNFGTYGSYGFDLTNTTYSQVYKGMGSANSTTNQAVEATAGQYILYGGSPISAVYHSCDGGATENVANVWGTSAAYLAGVADPYEVTPSNVQWSKTYTPSELYSTMRSRDSSFNLANIASVNVQYTTLGNMYSITFTDSNGTSKSYVRDACRTTVLKGETYNSQRFTITANASAASASADDGDVPLVETEIVEAPDYDLEVMGYAVGDDGQLVEIVPEPGEPEILEMDALTMYHSAQEIIAMDEAGLLDTGAEEREARAADESVSAYSAGSYTISNKAYGHNLGMSQYGARHMAEAGYTYTDIIHFYYAGVTIDGAGNSGNNNNNNSGFTDVKEGEWYYDAVQYVSEQGLMTGTSSTTFSPDQTTTRGMFVTILGRMAGIDQADYAYTGTVTGTQVNFRSGPGTGYSVLGVFSSGAQVKIIGKSGSWYQVTYNGQTGYISGDYLKVGSGTFSDVPAGEYYTAYVQWASSQGIVNGTGANTFSPDRLITREEMCAMLYNYCQKTGVTLQQDTSITAFADYASVQDYARTAVTAMQQAKLIEGTGDNRFEPSAHSDRAAMAQLIKRFHETYQ